MEYQEFSTRLLSAYTKNNYPIFFSNKRNYFFSDIFNKEKLSEIYSLKRKLVICLSENTVDFMQIYLNLLNAGCVPLLVEAGIKNERLDYLLQLYRPYAVLAPKEVSSERSLNFESNYIENYKISYFKNNQTAVHDNLAILLGTSGSTGGTKFVRLSYKNLISNANAIAEYLGLDNAEIPITTLPPSYSFGLSIIHSHLIVGAKIVVTKKTFFDRDFWSLFNDAAVTSLSGVPYHYEILKKLKIFNMDLGNLKTFTQAGGSMSIDLLERFSSFCQEKNIKFFSMYGQTEASPRMSYVPSGKAVTKSGTIGIAIPGGELNLVDENGKTITTSDTQGTLIYKGPNVFLGYANKGSDLSNGDELNGVLNTGDIAIKDNDGYYKIIGRTNRFIKLFGNRVNLQDIEKYLLSKKIESVCAGIDDNLMIFILESSKCDLSLVQKMIGEFLKLSKSIVSVYNVKAFPRNNSGKILYNHLVKSKLDKC